MLQYLSDQVISAAMTFQKGGHRPVQSRIGTRMSKQTARKPVKQPAQQQQQQRTRGKKGKQGRLSIPQPQVQKRKVRKKAGTKPGRSHPVLLRFVANAVPSRTTPHNRTQVNHIGIDSGADSTITRPHRVGKDEFLARQRQAVVH